MRLARVLWGVLLMLPMASCIRDTSLDTGEKPLVVVECILANSPEQTLRLCFTKGASREQLPLNEADARLYDVSADVEAGHFLPSGNGNWTLGYEPVPGHTYRLEVSVLGYEPVTSEQTVPEIDVKAYLFGAFQDSGQYQYDYHSYPLIVYEMESLPEYTWIYAMSWDERSGKRRIADNLCTDYPYVDNFNLTGELYNPPVDTVYQWGLEFHYALYWPLNGTNMHRKYLRIPHPEQVKRRWLVLSGDMEGEFPYEYTIAPYKLINDGLVENPKDGQGYVVFVAVSEDYDTYLTDAIRLQLLQESSDMSSLYLRENVYSNIRGGLGIFGAKTERKLVWMKEKSVFFDGPNNSEDPYLEGE